MINYLFLEICFETSLIGIWVVIGLTANFLLYINIAKFLVPVLFAKYSVIPKYLFF